MWPREITSFLLATLANAKNCLPLTQTHSHNHSHLVYDIMGALPSNWHLRNMVPEDNE